MKDVDCCFLCGGRQAEHSHAFRWMVAPDSCVCNPRSWQDGQRTEIPPVCGEYVHSEKYGNCQTCEHERGCHEGAN